jgi:hypothetical protein
MAVLLIPFILLLFFWFPSQHHKQPHCSIVLVFHAFPKKQVVFFGVD